MNEDNKLPEILIRKIPFKDEFEIVLSDGDEIKLTESEFKDRSEAVHHIRKIFWITGKYLKLNK